MVIDDDHRESGATTAFPDFASSSIRFPLALLLLAKLRREFGAEILRLEHLANFDFGLSGIGFGSAHPFDRLILRLTATARTRRSAPSFRQRSVDHRALGT